MHRRAYVATAGTVLAGGCLNARTRSEEDSDPTVIDSMGENVDVVVTITAEPSFDPDSVEIEVGETVGWKNDDHRIQTVTAYESEIPDDAEYFASGGYSREVIATIIYPFRGGIDPEKGFTHTFETRGRYEYYSIPSEHLGMVGEVIVQ
jgi:plastocyanin